MNIFYEQSLKETKALIEEAGGDFVLVRDMNINPKKIDAFAYIPAESSLDPKGWGNWHVEYYPVRLDRSYGCVVYALKYSPKKPEAEICGIYSHDPGVYEGTFAIKDIGDFKVTVESMNREHGEDVLRQLMTAFDISWW